jgi:Fur family zinc uptake transcriptional regulator
MIPPTPDPDGAPDSAAFPAPDHDHCACRDSARARAEAALAARGMRLTGLRATVFDEVAASHHAVGAYEILAALARKGSRLAPISVYRALDALREAGVVHRLESRNAYFACHARHTDGHHPIVLACSACGAIAEVDSADVDRALGAAVDNCGFRTERRLIELTGICAHCSATAPERGHADG